MTTPAVTAAPLPAAPAAAPAPSVDGGERFASALDDAVAGGQGRSRGQAALGEADAPTDTAGTGEEPTAPDEKAPTDPPVTPAGIPPGLWALLTGLGSGAPGAGTAPVQAPAAPVAGLTGPVASARATATAAAAAPGGDVPAGAVPGGQAASGRVPGGQVPSGQVPGGSAPSGAGLAATALPGAASPAVTAAQQPTVPPAAVLPAEPALAPPGTGPAVGPAADAAGLPPVLVVPAGPTTGGADSTLPPIPAAASPTTPADPATPAPAPESPGEQNAPTTPPAAAGAPAPAPVAAAPTTVAPAAGTPSDSGAAPVGTQVAQHVAVLRNGPDGVHTMTVVLTPETLGTVEVHVTLTQGAVDLTLRGATEAGRAALLDALPDLRRDLQSAGLTCGSATVDRDPGSAWTTAQQQPGGDRAGQQGSPDGRGRPWLRAADGDPGRPAAVPPATTTASGLDVRV